MRRGTQRELLRRSFSGGHIYPVCACACRRLCAQLAALRCNLAAGLLLLLLVLLHYAAFHSHARLPSLWPQMSSLARRRHGADEDRCFRAYTRALAIKKTTKKNALTGLPRDHTERKEKKPKQQQQRRRASSSLASPPVLPAGLARPLHPHHMLNCWKRSCKLQITERAAICKCFNLLIEKRWSWLQLSPSGRQVGDEKNKQKKHTHRSCDLDII